MLFIRTKIVSHSCLRFVLFILRIHLRKRKKSFLLLLFFVVVCFVFVFLSFFSLFVESVVSFILISGVYLAAVLLESHLAPDPPPTAPPKKNKQKKKNPFDITRGRFLWSVDCSAKSPL